MNKFILKIIANSLAIYFAAYIFPSIILDSSVAPLLAGLALTLLNLLLRPFLVLLLSPFIFLTAGFLTLIINTWMLMLVDWMIPFLHIPGFWLKFVVAVMIAVFDLGAVKLYRRCRLST